MTPPDYFLCDLPPDAALTPQMVSDACDTLRRNRERHLLPRPTADLVRGLADVAAEWLRPENAFRREALEQGPAVLGFSRETLARGLDGFFQQLTVENLSGWLVQEFGHVSRLDAFVQTAPEFAGSRSLARPPALLAHFAAGNIPNPALKSLVTGLLVRSAQFLKCARGTALLPRLFAHSVYEMHPKLGACIEIAEWPGGSHEIEAPLLTAADCVTATGGDEAIASVRARVDLGRTRFIGHGHRVSFGYVGREMLARHSLAETVRAAVADISAWDQLGCLSPHVLYIETKGNVPPEFFAEELAKALEAHEAVQPRGATDVMTAAAITSRRGVYEVRAAAGSDTLLWQSKGSTAWTVVFEADPRFQASCLHRFIYVKPVENLQETLHTAELVRGKVSTVGLAAIESRAAELARELAHWGVPRICPLGRMQSPPLAWRHDGRPPLAELVEWTDWETE